MLATPLLPEETLGRAPQSAAFHQSSPPMYITTGHTSLLQPRPAPPHGYTNSIRYTFFFPNHQPLPNSLKCMLASSVTKPSKQSFPELHAFLKPSPFYLLFSHSQAF